MKKTVLIPLVLFSLIASCSDDSIPPGVFAVPQPAEKSFNTTLTLTPETITRTYEAVGTVRPLTETTIESQINAQILRMHVKPGTRVSKGDLLIELDARNEQAQLNKALEGLELARNNLKQAQKARDAAEAGLDQARAEFERTSKLYESGVVASQKYEADQAAFLKAKAGLEQAGEGVLAGRTGIRQAEQVINSARIMLSHSVLRAPAGGVIVDRLADPGDLAIPGKPLLVLQTSGSLRLEASVREGVISRIHHGQTYDVRIETIGRTVPAVIEEIVPYADPATRTFLVKADLPQIPGLYPGMFGRLLIPIQEETAVLIPRQAIEVVGQLELVHVRDKDGGRWRSICIRTGRAFDERVEVTAGLTGSETIGYQVQ